VLAVEHQDFAIPCSALGVVPQEKVLATDSVTVKVFTTAELASFEGGAAEWADLPAGQHSRYVVVTDLCGAEALSGVQTVSIAGGIGKRRQS
jgi:hypothetical protein